jgi:AraC-like DNA-binding protein
VARPKKEAPIATTLLPAVRRFIGLLGESASDDEVALPLSAIEDELEEIATARGEPELGLTLPARLTFPRYGLGELAARASSDVRSALERLARFVPLSVPGAVGSMDSGFAVRFPPRARRPSRVLNEWALAHALHTVREETGEFLQPQRVWFAHARPRDLGPLHVFFGTRDLDFGEESSGFVLSVEALARPLRAHDARLAATMEQIASSSLPSLDPSYAERVGRAIKLPDTTIESAARALHASARTLQRNLEAEGTTFSEVLDRRRASLARTLLRDTNEPIAEIAARVGFSDVAPFTRAFRRWTGTPPGAFRRR